MEEKKIQEEFNRILASEKKTDWARFSISNKLLALFCYGIPALMFLSGYHPNKDMISAIIFTAILGTGFYTYFRHERVVRAFFTNSKPLKEVIAEIKAQESLDRRANPSEPVLSDTPTSLSPVEEKDWEMILNNFDAAVEDLNNPTDNTMSANSIFDRQQNNQTDTPPGTSWISRFFKRN